MKIILQQRDLKESINIVQRGVSTKTTLPILKGILLEAKDGLLTLTGNDLDIGIENKIQCNVVEEGSVVVPSRLFGEIIRKLPDGEVSITVDSNNNIDIRCGYSQFNLMGDSSQEYPELPYVQKENTYHIAFDLLRNMIRQTIFATAQDDTRPILTGVLIEIEDNSISMVAVDGYRLALRKAFIDSGIDNKAVVPAKTLMEISRILGNESYDKDVEISFTDKHILFSIENTRVISRLLEGEFINYEQILPKEYNTRAIVKTREILDSIERASLLAKEGKNNLIKLNIMDDFINISSNVEIGSVNERVEVKLEGDDLEIGFNSKYLLDALKVIDSEEIVMEFTTSVSPCIIKPCDNENYIYLVLPVRLSR